MLSKEAGPFIPLKIQDFDRTYKLEALMEDVECPLCMTIKEDMVECPNCSTGCCRECITDFTARSGKGNPNQNKFQCSVCDKVTVFSTPNEIMKQVFQHLMFKCNNACKQTYPFKELKTHRTRGLCYKGYIRPDDEVPELVASATTQGS